MEDATPRTSVFIEDLLAEEVLARAYAWLCKRRKGYPSACDIWSFRRRWPEEKARLRAELAEGRYRMTLLSRVTLKTQEEVDVWSARDALVLKALALVFGQRFPFSKQCTHLKGHGGAKGAVRQVLRVLPEHRFVLRTDVHSYYASIDHELLLDRLAAFVKDRRILNLVAQYLKRSAERGGCYWQYPKGLPLGCPLSPVMGALFLSELDSRLEQLGLFFVRFMDDILVLAPTRWKLRAAVRIVNQLLASLGLAKHPDKTFIGRVEKGFDFLGYHFSPEGLGVAGPTVDKFIARALLLYEHGPGEALASARLGAYVGRWVRWLGSGLAFP